MKEAQMSVETAPVDPPRWTLPLAALTVALFIVLHPYGFLEAEDAAVYFNYYNNGIDAGLPFYYAGYAALLPELAAFGAAFLPLPVQPPLYMVAAALIGVYFVWQLLIFIHLNVKVPALAWCLAATIVLVLIKTNSSFNFFTNLTYAIWMAWLGLYLRLLNAFRGVRAGPLLVIVGALAALSHPFCVLLLPPIVALLLLAPRRPGCVIVECVVYVAATALYSIFLIERGFSKPIDPAAILAKIKLLLGANITAYVPITFASEVLLMLVALPALYRLLRSLWTPDARRHKDVEIAVMAYIGWSTLFAFVVSPRFLSYETFQPRYMLAALVSLFLAAIVLASSAAPVATRLDAIAKAASPGRWPLGGPRAMAATAGYIVLLLLANSVKGRQTPELGFGAIVAGERFLLAAEAFRNTCSDGVMIDRWSKWSPALLCQPAALPSGIEAVGISSDKVSFIGTTELVSTAGRPPETVPTIYHPIQDIAILRVRQAMER
eukprot:gene21780-22748_t